MSNKMIDKVVGYMKVAEEFNRYTGNQKKDFVMKAIAKDFPELYKSDALIDMLDDMIDVIILLDKNKLKIRKGFQLFGLCK